MVGLVAIKMHPKFNYNKGTMIKKLALPIAGFLVISLLSSYMCIFGKKEGIKGYVYLVKGNQMPSPGEPPPLRQGLQTTVYVYELTNVNQVKRVEHSSFYSAINTKLIKEIRSDKKGYFKVKLPPGDYSVFIRKDSLFYANLFDGNNNIAPVKVSKGKWVELELKADYDAVY